MVLRNLLDNLVCLGIFIAIAAVLYSRRYPDVPADPLTREEAVIAAWKAKIKTPSSRFTRVTVGLNANVDLIVKGTAVLRSLGVAPGGKQDHSVLASIPQLQESFQHFLSKGSAAERVFTSAADFQKVVKGATSLPKKEWYVGGNAALMAQKIVTIFPDTQVQLVGPIGPKLKSLLNKKIQVPQGSLSKEDEVHLIMEYEVGEKWGSSQAPVATRFITSHDMANSQATQLETYFKSAQQFKPDLMALSGLHLLEGTSPEFWNKRLGDLVANLKKLSPSIPVHLELASMANKDFLYQIMTQALHEVTSLGLNEQEITFASEAGGGPHGNMFNENQGNQPEIHKIVDIMQWLLETYGQSPKNPNSRLTRIHFHCLTYHIVGYVSSSWENVDSAVAAGSRMAGRQACDIPTLESEKVTLRIPEEFKMFSGDDIRQFNASEPVISWSLGNNHFSFSPVLVCKKPLKTVGLGDSISATGLLFSQFNPKSKNRTPKG